MQPEVFLWVAATLHQWKGLTSDDATCCQVTSFAPVLRRPWMFFAPVACFLWLSCRGTSHRAAPRQGRWTRWGGGQKMKMTKKQKVVRWRKKKTSSGAGRRSPDGDAAESAAETSCRGRLSVRWRGGCVFVRVQRAPNPAGPLFVYISIKDGADERRWREDGEEGGWWGGSLITSQADLTHTHS